MNRCARVMVIAAVPISMLASASSAQVPGVPLGSLGGIARRFMSAETLSRLLDRPEGVADSVPISAPIDSIWSGLKTVVQRLELPVGFQDKGVLAIGVDMGKVYHQIGRSRVSEYLRCGEGATGPNADSYVVYLSYLTMVRQSPNSQPSLFTLVTGTAVDMAGGRNDPVNCATTGKLESKLGELVGKVVSGQGK